MPHMKPTQWILVALITMSVLMMTMMMIYFTKSTPQKKMEKMTNKKFFNKW